MMPVYLFVTVVVIFFLGNAIWNGMSAKEAKKRMEK
jgi:hypothetical protein